LLNSAGTLIGAAAVRVAVFAGHALLFLRQPLVGARRRTMSSSATRN
jgi:hypothetical protein